jgi:anti-anti-sigma regulatory factor
MTLKIETFPSERGTTLRLIGRLQSENLGELMSLMTQSSMPLLLDLEDLTLVDASVVRYLGVLEAEGIQLVGCAPYIREWIKLETT